MTRKPRGKFDLLEHEIAMALKPGAFLPDRACYSFVNGGHVGEKRMDLKSSRWMVSCGCVGMIGATSGD